MQLINVDFTYEGLVTLSKEDVIKMFKEYIDKHKGDDYYPQTVKECIDEICDSGCFEIDSGYISMNIAIRGCPEELIKDIFENT